MQRARLVLICGLPGSGKTRLAKRLALELRAVRLSPDEWKHALGIDYYDEQARVRLEDRLWQLARELLTLGHTVVMENGFWTREELWRRLELRNKAAEPGTVPIERSDLDRWAAQFEPPDAAELALFDAPGTRI